MTEPLVVVGITGVARSGKDTLAGLLCHRDGFFRVALGDAVRSAIRDMDGPTWAITKELEAAGKNTRWGCQKVGGDARERVADLIRCAVEDGDTPDDECSWSAGIGANRCWSYLACVKIAYLATIHPVPQRRFVVPDISYPHEPDALGAVVRQLGGRYETWRVERAGSGLAGAAGSHPSEIGRATVPADLTIANDGAPEDMIPAFRGRLEALSRQ